MLSPQGLRPVLGVAGFVGDVAPGPPALVPGQVGPQEGGHAHGHEIQGPQQQGLEGVAVLVEQELLLRLRRQASGHEDEHAQGHAAPAAVVEGGHRAAHPFAGAAAVAEGQGEARQGLRQAPGPLPQPVCSYRPAFHGSIIVWPPDAVKKA